MMKGLECVAACLHVSCLCILGTFLTRSGIVSSVHAFAPIQHRQLVRGLSRDYHCGVLRGLFEESDYLRSEIQIDSIVFRVNRASYSTI